MKKFNVEEYKSEAEIIRQTAEQVILDFERFGMQIQFSGHTHFAYQELSLQLCEHLEQLLIFNTEKLMALLYQVDIRQDTIAHAAKSHPDWTHTEVLAELVIHRELKKVVIRKYIKENPDWINE
ncbi:MAG: hypothetical protein JEZ03_18465 [Bacteroidales bacterium]|nr:hypothetical protein [Bacteroidales bacterium]